MSYILGLALVLLLVYVLVKMIPIIFFLLQWSLIIGLGLFALCAIIATIFTILDR